MLGASPMSRMFPRFITLVCIHSGKLRLFVITVLFPRILKFTIEVALLCFVCYMPLVNENSHQARWLLPNSWAWNDTCETVSQPNTHQPRNMTFILWLLPFDNRGVRASFFIPQLVHGDLVSLTNTCANNSVYQGLGKWEETT